MCTEYAYRQDFENMYPEDLTKMYILCRESSTNEWNAEAEHAAQTTCQTSCMFFHKSHIRGEKRITTCYNSAITIERMLSQHIFHQHNDKTSGREWKNTCSRLSLDVGHNSSALLSFSETSILYDANTTCKEYSNSNADTHLARCLYGITIFLLPYLFEYKGKVCMVIWNSLW